MKTRIAAICSTFALFMVIATSPASAGGIGNFYNTAHCSPAGHSALVGKGSNYDINFFADEEYHHSGTPSSGAWKLVGVFYDGIPWPFYGHDSKGFRGTRYDGYQDFNSYWADHKIYFQWNNGVGGVAICATPAF